MIQVLLLLTGIACGIVLVRGATTSEVSPRDRRVLEARYRQRGLQVIALRRIGTDRLLTNSRFRRGPIRKYEVQVEGPDGRRDTRIRGVAMGELGGDRVYRDDREGRIELLP